MTSRIKKSLYLERRLTTTGMMAFHRFEESFHRYEFQWMITTPGKYSEVLVIEFYVAPKGELKR